MILSFHKLYSGEELDEFTICPTCNDRKRFSTWQALECIKCGWILNFVDGDLIELSVELLPGEQSSTNHNRNYAFVSCEDAGIWESYIGVIRDIPALVKYVERVEFGEAVRGLREAGERLMVLV
jgi:hypothetical protein